MLFLCYYVLDVHVSCCSNAFTRFFCPSPPPPILNYFTEFGELLSLTFRSLAVSTSNCVHMCVCVCFKELNLAFFAQWNFTTTFALVYFVYSVRSFRFPGISFSQSELFGFKFMRTVHRIQHRLRQHQLGSQYMSRHKWKIISELLSIWLFSKVLLSNNKRSKYPMHLNIILCLWNSMSDISLENLHVPIPLCIDWMLYGFDFGRNNCQCKLHFGFLHQI